ncbi:cell division protein FtsZ [Polymorphobacter fuscus]|uniref:Cell division protein FtsZ n=1 Tax=Sandarakinorhabdus fusca TaxID=1439888 RepID=A0A7C9KK24_9SPHN|nr:cell division protein FtsZ [Polymorphobacter fuscus]KAB7644456.1 cell division protein FtsZ [Polymorphobacter fuscus]MQT18381.1 cell division protein FtsZ [Polymorphobacter fuscus]NJC08281.1 cell division protein FtsZ [Polymorphobacter fuscus]
MLEFERPELTELKPRITVVGVGGAGCNAVANMIAADLQGVDFIVANTDAQSLAASKAETRIQLGMKITQGLGAGARPEIGRAAAEETLDQLETSLEGAHMCFIAAGMGGGTGTGAAPVVARAAREKGILTVGVVTKPFTFEGNKRMRAAEEGIAELQKHVDTLIIIPNQNLFLIANANTTFKDAFAMADQVLHQGVRGITDLMIMPGLINLDFADIRTVMSEMGKAMMGTGEATGERRALEAAEKAIANPLLDEVSMRGAKGVIINITGGEDLRLMEVDEAATYIRDMVDPEANIIVGSAFNKNLDGIMRVSVVATGIDAATRAAAPAPAPASRPRVDSGFAAQPSIFTMPPVAAAAPATTPAVSVPEPVAAAVTEPVADVVPEPVEMDLGVVAERIDEDEVAAPVPEPVAPVVVPIAPPVAVEEERPMSLFEKMLNMSRGPKARPAPTPTLAPEPTPPAASDVDIPPFFKRQVNN